MRRADLDALRAMADDIIKTDGDRDHMNPSRLSVRQTVAVGKALRLCADEIERLSHAGAQGSDR